MRYLILLFFVFSLCLFAQPNVRPLPNYDGMTYEQIITMYPTYYTTTNQWYGNIYYYNTALPGLLKFYFHNNVCYGMQYVYRSYDSTESRNVYNQYVSYIKDSLSGGYVYSNWGGIYPYEHHFWADRSGGRGAIMWDASRIHYTHIVWDDNYYLVWFSIFDENRNGKRLYPPKTKPRARLQ